MLNLVWSSTFQAFTTFPFTRKFKSEGKAFLCIHASRLAGLGLLDLPGSTERLTPLLDFSVATLYPRKTLSAQAKSQCQDESFSMHWHAMTLILQQFVRRLILFKDIWQFKAILTAWYCSESSVTEALPSRPQSFVENNFVGPVWSFQQKVFLVSLWPHDCSNFQSLGWNSVSFFKSMLMHPD